MQAACIAVQAKERLSLPRTMAHQARAKPERKKEEAIPVNHLKTLCHTTFRLWKCFGALGGPVNM